MATAMTNEKTAQATQVTQGQSKTQPLIVVDMKAWRMKDYRHFMRATQESEFDGMFDTLSKVIISWPYAGDPSDPASFDELTMDEWLEVTKAVGSAMSNQFSQGN